MVYFYMKLIKYLYFLKKDENKKVVKLLLFCLYVDYVYQNRIFLIFYNIKVLRYY